MAVQQFCLRWNNHQPNFISVFSNLLNNESLVDVTLAAEGRHLQAHKVILSACSSYFQSLFMANPCQHPIVILKDVNFIDLKTMVDFMYYGEVNVSQEQLPHILKTAEMLKIKGLAEMPDTTLLSKSHSTSSDKTDLLKLGESNYSTEIQRQSMSPSPCSLSPSARRKRLRKTSLGSGSGSTEQTSEEHPNEISVSSPGDSGVSTVTTKMELNTSFTLDGNTTRHTTIKQHSSTDSDTIRNAPKQQSMEHEHDQHNISHISLQISQPDMSTPQHSDNQLVGVPGPSVPASTSHPASQEKSIGTKRGRFLPRQSRLKKDCDQVSPEREIPVMHLLSAPMKVERQFSDPSPGLLSTSNTSTIVKQHSHPFLSSHSEQSHIHAPYYSSLSTEGGRATSPIALDTIQTLRVRTDDLKHISPDTPVNSPRSSHCPAVRPGPALGCNYCWNTIDNHGRILRRKTKYHCPECQTNLCIVPCFQEYHERQTRSAELDENFSTKSKNVSI